MWKQFRILNPKNSRVIDPWSLFYFLKIGRLFASFYRLYCWLWTYFSPLSSVSTVNYENVKAHYTTCFVLELLRYLLPEEVYKPFHILGQKQKFELFPIYIYIYVCVCVCVCVYIYILFKEKTNSILIKIFRLLSLSIHVNIYQIYIPKI